MPETGHPLTPGHRVNEVWVLVTVDAAGDEGITAVDGLALVASMPKVRDRLAAAIGRLEEAYPTQKFVMRHFVRADQ